MYEQNFYVRLFNKVYPFRLQRDLWNVIFHPRFWYKINLHLIQMLNMFILLIVVII